MIRSTFPRSRNERRCTDCGKPIPKGSIYRRCAASPNHGDLGNKDWWVASVCRDCDSRWNYLHGWPPAEA